MAQLDYHRIHSLLFGVCAFSLAALAYCPNSYAGGKDGNNQIGSEARARLATQANFVSNARPSEESLTVPGKSQIYPLPSLEPVALVPNSVGEYALNSLPSLRTEFMDRRAAISQRRDYVFFTLENRLQEEAEKLALTNRAAHTAIVVMDPANGHILAMADKSPSIQHLTLHTGFPAASLFKVVTTAAALEKGTIRPDTKINFRGGVYALNEWNYLPDPRRDRMSLTVSEALGKSCNPVFGRIGLNLVGSSLLSYYARSFGFDMNLRFDAPLEPSSASVPFDDFGLSRTSAGFGEVRLSPVHAATIAAGLGHQGLMPKPIIIDKVISPDGVVRYQSKPEFLQRMIKPETNRTLLDMMEYTTTMGTSRREFMRKKDSVLSGIRVAAKTGTLKGDNPEGLTNWFIATAPIENPSIALAVVVVNSGGATSKASHIGRVLIQKYFGQDSPEIEPVVCKSKKTSVKKSKSQTISAKKYVKSSKTTHTKNKKSKKTKTK